MPLTAQEDGAPVGLSLFASGLTAPVDLDSPADGSGRTFVSDQAGVVYLVNADGTLTPFLDIRDRLVELDPEYDERGLLGLALHPDFANNGRFFVYYSAPLRPEAPPDWDHTAILSEFASSGDAADPGSERFVLLVDQPQMNHNAGDIAFGPDGFLYVPLGDGGGANDNELGHTEGTGNGQDLSNLLGSLLRIDVNSGDPYGIPADNPFTSNTAVPPETFAYGFRNPWRISFDDQGRLFVADAGQELYEEISIVPPGGNLGWFIKEGTHCFDPANPENPPAECPSTGADGAPLIDPVIEFGHDLGNVVVGGDTYTGSVPELSGQYIFGTWSTNFDTPEGELFAATPTEGGLWPFARLPIANNESGSLGLFILSIEKGGDNETYVLTSGSPAPVGQTGEVWRIVPAGQGSGPTGGAAEQPDMEETPMEGAEETPMEGAATPTPEDAPAEPTAEQPAAEPTAEAPPADPAATEESTG